jgi:simple sugar transport system substrate-binding protein
MSITHGATKQWRLALIGLVGAATLVAVAGCTATSTNGGGSSAPAAASSGSIIEVGGPVSDPYFQPMKLGSDDAAKALGITYQYSAAKDYSNTVPDYVQLLTQAISKKPAGLIVWNTNPAALSPLIKQAVGQGIAVVEISSGTDNWQDDGAISFVGEDHTATGVAAGEAAAKTGVTHLLCVNNAGSNPGLQQRCNGAEQGMAKAGGSSEQIILPDTSVNNPSQATQTIQGYLASHSDIDGVWSQNSSVGGYVATAVENLNKSSIKQSTLGVSKSTIQLLQKGTLSLVVDLQQWLIGYDALQMMQQYLQYGVHPTGAILPGALAVTKDNLQSTLDVMNKYPGVRGAN